MGDMSRRAASILLLVLRVAAKTSSQEVLLLLPPARARCVETDEDISSHALTVVLARIPGRTNARITTPMLLSLVGKKQKKTIISRDVPSMSSAYTTDSVRLVIIPIPDKNVRARTPRSSSALEVGILSANQVSTGDATSNTISLNTGDICVKTHITNAICLKKGKYLSSK